ncbi:MAG: Omp28 family outer membrane lipoprotein [Bacteroidales bacterium]|nr:Omp28 family outer membrane lipoprotein [Bacteroidales bacterium]
MRYKFNYIIILFLFIAFVSCDKIEPPYKKKITEQNDTLKQRKVLLEDFTGHKCVNCPGAANTIVELKQQFSERLVVISVHSGFFAAPDPSGNYTYDFRTTTGTDIDNFFGISAAGVPNGMINRKEYGTGYFVGPTDWGTKINEIINEPPDAYIEITNNYTSTNRILNVNVKTEFLKSLSGTYKLCVYITEDSIIKYQKNNSPELGPVPDIANFVHQHVLRSTVNSTWGDTLTNGNALAGFAVFKNYSIILNNEWIEKNCTVVAFIYNVVNYEIIQAEEKKIIL